MRDKIQFNVWYPLFVKIREQLIERDCPLGEQIKSYINTRDELSISIINLMDLRLKKYDFSF